jgi:hypothetical protein
LSWAICSFTGSLGVLLVPISSPMVARNRTVAERSVGRWGQRCFASTCLLLTLNQVQQ